MPGWVGWLLALAIVGSVVWLVVIPALRQGIAEGRQQEQDRRRGLASTGQPPPQPSDHQGPPADYDG